MANNIDFETSYIDRMFEEKNRRIAQLEKENEKLRTELEFYRNSRKQHNGFHHINKSVEDSFSKSIDNYLKTNMNGQNELDT